MENSLTFPPEARIFRGEATPNVSKRWQILPAPPSWRQWEHNLVNDDAPQLEKSDLKPRPYTSSEDEIEMVNAALYLRRPLLITGAPGTGKSSLAAAVAAELGMGPLLVWPITTRSTLADGLYRYDAIARLQEVTLRRETQMARLLNSQTREREDVEVKNDETGNSLTSIERFLRLGPLGTALVGHQIQGVTRPRALLIDEIDKSDVDLPNDLLNVFEQGEFEIPELSRLPTKTNDLSFQIGLHGGGYAGIQKGFVRCREFPLVILTSNGEREFPPAFLRRCLRLHVEPPKPDKLLLIVQQHLQPDEQWQKSIDDLVNAFVERRDDGATLATDQLLNAVYLVMRGVDLLGRDRDRLIKDIFFSLSDYAD